MKKLKVILLALLLVIGVSAVGSATTMEYLLQQGNYIDVGDKRFSDWSYVLYADDAGIFDDGTILSAIEVFGVGADTMSPGIRFQSSYVGQTGAPLSLFSVNDGKWLDVEFTFRVSVLKPGYQINGVSLAFSGSVESNGGNDSIAIGEFIGEPKAEWDAFAEVSPTEEIEELTDTFMFAAVSEIWVIKDIALLSDAFILNDDGTFTGGGTVTVDWVEQRFHQTAVPEPSTMLLLGAGLLGLCGVTRKKRE